VPGPTRRRHIVFSALTRSFVARFFDNEITAGSGDLKDSFFWLIAFLAPLGILMPWFRTVAYQGIVLVQGTDMLRRVSLADKALYLTLGMAAAGVVAVITWNALLIDRRDALVLGVLPLRVGTIVYAKLVALSIYIGIIVIGMHVGASVSFGFILGTGNTLWFVGSGILAHLVASCVGGMFVLFSVTALQGLLLATSGATTFMRLSPILQFLVGALVLSALVGVPLITHSVVDAIDSGGGRHAWVLATPPVWFVGLYEWSLGTSDPLLRHLAATAGGATAMAVGLTAATYPMAYRRLMRAAVEDVSEGDRPSRFAVLARGLVRVLARRPVTRASIQFLLATVSRAETHRFVLALCAGTIAAFVLPACLSLVSAPLPSAPPVAFLAAPVVAIVFSLVGLRLAAALPAEIRAAWLFPAVDPPGRQARAGVWRTMFAFGVCPAVAVFVPCCWRLWGDLSLAFAHGLLCLAIGGLLTEALLWGYASMPCSSPWHPGRANLRAWWWAYLGAFVLLVQGVPRLSVALHGQPVPLGTAGAIIAACAMILRLFDHRRVAPPSRVEEEAAGGQVLNLD
jgi:hypothetical protein